MDYASSKTTHQSRSGLSFFVAVVLLVLLGAVSAPVAWSQEAPRGVYIGDAPPAGVTVLDNRGDWWLVSGDASRLKSIPNLRLLEASRPAIPPRTFTPVHSPLVDELVAQVQSADLLAQIEWLIGLGVRVSNSPNMPVVADSLEAKLASFGLETEQHEFPLSTLTIHNVIATKTGVVEPDSVFVLCAHYDATSDFARFSTPGADDNGTGTVTLLTAARLLSTVSVDYTVKFVLFAGEEQGLVGSQHWTADMAAEGLPILGALNFDMMGWWEEGVPFDLEIETNDASRWMADAICWAADTYTTMPYELHVDNAAYWGDFYPFWQNGYAAVNHEEAWDWGDPDFNPNYHTTEDTIEKLSPEFLEGSARIGVAALASLAGVSRVASAPELPVGRSRLVASPNPFNGRIVFELAADGVEGSRPLSIYDLRGRMVAEITLPLSGGRGQAMWDARDRSGRNLPAGVYLAVARTLPGRPSSRVTYLP